MTEQVDQNHRSKLLAPKEYKAGGTNVQISAREFLPFKEHNNKQEALVLFPGWAANEKSPSYNELALSLADSFGRRVLLVNTRPEDLVEDSLYHEAEATHQFLKEMDITDAILAGYSEGGVKAVNLAVIAQESPTVNPEALILLAPHGLVAQTPLELVKTFALDTLLETIPRIIREKSTLRSMGKGIHPDSMGSDKDGVKTVQLSTPEPDHPGKVVQSLEAGRDVTRGALKEISQDRLQYPKRPKHDIVEMSKLNPRLDKIKTPVILIQGKHDKNAGPKGVLTKEQMARQDEGGVIKKALEKLFPKSPHVDRILASRTSKHVFPLLRSPQIARVASYLLGRQKREKV